MFRRILIANRGEVAARVMRTCKRLGITAVAVYTDPDAELAYLQEVDEAVHIGGKRAYLDGSALIEAALAARCSAIHPGWGFLSENATFSARCEAARLTFIGPRSRNIRIMGDKSRARETMAALGVPIIPGSDGVLRDAEHAAEVAAQIGYPVLLKALSGGGGRGMRRVYEPSAVADAFAAASAEAAGAFNDGRMYLEKLIERGRHIEFQVLSDGERAVVLGERECSIQRRHQKLIEETPSPVTTPEEVAEMAKMICAAVVGIGYRGAGTIEMLRDRDGLMYFMEMNTRLQVEHTITEDRYGVDLVEQQLLIAANHPLTLSASPTGHAIECRINAEDPADNFRPTPGVVSRLVLPAGEGIRIETHLREGDRISPHYDSMFAKVIAHGADRAEAIARMIAALEKMVVEGVSMTIPLHLSVLRHPRFAAGDYDTHFLEENLEALR
jgi:acetyl-CoA carboxylase biotin carboxylase subunit